MLKCQIWKKNIFADIHKSKKGWAGRKYHHKQMKEFGLKVWHRWSGTEVSLTSQSKNHEPGSAKPTNEVCNGFMSKFTLSFLVCLWYWNFPALYVPTGMCFYAYICLHACVRLLITLCMEQTEFHQLMPLVYKSHYVCIQNHWRVFYSPIQLILHPRKLAGNMYVPPTTSGQSALTVTPLSYY